MAEYRIVIDHYSGYEVQIRRWYWPFWRQVKVNTHRTVAAAEEYARQHAHGALVKYLGRL